MNEANKIKLGAFIVISVTLLIIAFLSAGALRIFAPRIRAMTEVNTSVEGLAVGSPVKYLGMPVGKVTGMYMRRSDGMIIIFFDIFSQSFADDIDSEDDDGVFDQFDLDKMLTEGKVSCLVNASGLMGGSHLELVRERSVSSAVNAYAKPTGKVPPGVSFIPSSPSHIGNAIQNVSRMLEEMKSIDWNGFAEKINGSLDNLNALLNKQELDAALKRFERIGTSLEQTAARLEKVVTKENIDQINTAIGQLNESTRNILKTSTNEKISETMNNLNAFLLSARNIIAQTEQNAGGVRSELRTFISNLDNSVGRLENTLTALNDLLQNISRDPAQFVRGRQEPEK